MLLTLGLEAVESAGVPKNSQINIWALLKQHRTHVRERPEALGLVCVQGSDYQVVWRQICKVGLIICGKGWESDKTNSIFVFVTFWNITAAQHSEATVTLKYRDISKAM